jgi:hypothetical protein
MQDDILSQSHLMAFGMYYTPFKYIVTTGVGNHYPTYAISETASGNVFGEPVSSISEEEMNKKMGIANARYMVTLEPLLKQGISGMRYFKRIADISGFDIFEFSGPGLGWIDLKDKDQRNNYKIIRFNEENVRINVMNYTERNLLTLKVAYHPYWEAYVNGKKTTIRQNPDGFIELPLSKTGEFDVYFRYDSKKYLPIGVSMISFILAVFLIFQKKTLRLKNDG